MSDRDRWNQQQAARDYDAAAPAIHPWYLRVQDEVLAALPFAPTDAFRAIDLGGGSARLAERLLAAFPRATITVVDRSAAFLNLARGRVERFGLRADFVLSDVQDDAWQPASGVADAIVSTSALHHLEPAEKRAVFQACSEAQGPGGVLINGDEHRPESDVEYRQLLEAWGRHMRQTLADGRIPETFGDLIAKWQKRNLEDFGGPRRSGDDCHETLAAQRDHLAAAGFGEIETRWQQDLWAVTVAFR